MGPQTPEGVAPPPVISEIISPQAVSPMQIENVQPPLSSADEAERNFLKARSDQEAKVSSQPNITDENTYTAAQEEEMAAQARAAIEREAAESANIPQEEVLHPPKENKSFFAAIFEKIKNIFTAPQRAWNRIKQEMSAFIERINITLFKRPQSPPQAA
ncbi:hypothetical protein COW57_01590 [Candidatus Roizmanbacteria bacterium CG17_big_fil_post_rev_8_21_14_2_50_39_7]|uniref:Uncharacterized protein n=1 Tax=Candidatus Roizmanbacteria bacterium CG17_big_fil_post_rev_8_21_14_2_50_39_7 TaxID=1974858 RepID=A0A2M7EKK0_9BACT|nr:MAG: hypothetical protein COW57_01590 [Candidatus Roizmanbacteria bacterium CG17_big_fil_post_rev_8_21_14_2_50_39_7]